MAQHLGPARRPLPRGAARRAGRRRARPEARPVMGYSWKNVTGAVAGDANGYKTSVDMANGAYALDANAPTFGARHITIVRAVVNAADTPGTITMVGKGVDGQPQTEVMI